MKKTFTVMVNYFEQSRLFKNLKMEDHLKKIEDGRRPQTSWKWKMTLKDLKMEDDLFLEEEDDLNNKGTNKN